MPTEVLSSTWSLGPKPLQRACVALLTPAAKRPPTIREAESRYLYQIVEFTASLC